MKKFRTITALVLAVMMVMAVGSFAWADGDEETGADAGSGSGATTAASLTNGEVGGFTSPDTSTTQSKSVNIKKVIKAYNATSTSVHAPVVTYTYTVTPATVSNVKVTDDANDHASKTAVEAPVQQGITTGLVVTGTNAAGTAVAGAAGTSTSATATLVFDNTSTWTAAADGAENSYDIKLDFTSVSFTKPGVYRYQIAETISTTSYDVIAMKDGAYNTVYLDVYVDGSLNIYGYVCLKDNDSVTSSTSKINGFVDGTADGTDKYYTYDLTLTKDVVNDNYGEGHAFPFTVIFKNTENYTSTFTIEQTVGTGSTGLTTLTGIPTAWNGVALVKEDANVTIKGIPAGVDVDVFETNDMNGVTYTVATSVNNGSAVTDNNVSWGSAPTTAIVQNTKAAHESTNATIDTTKIAKVSAEQTLKITNTLLLISPTGYVTRFAPYALILVAGVALLVVAMKKRKTSDEE